MSVGLIYTEFILGGAVVHCSISQLTASLLIFVKSSDVTTGMLSATCFCYFLRIIAHYVLLLLFLKARFLKSNLCPDCYFTIKGQNCLTKYYVPTHSCFLFCILGVSSPKQCPLVARVPTVYSELLQQFCCNKGQCCLWEVSKYSQCSA